MATAPCCHDCCPSLVEEAEEEASIGVGSRTVGRFRVRLFWGSKHACPKLRSLLVPGAPRFNKKSIRRYGGRCMRSPGNKHKRVSQCPHLLLWAEHLRKEVGTWLERKSYHCIGGHFLRHLVGVRSRGASGCSSHFSPMGHGTLTVVLQFESLRHGANRS